MKKSIIFFLVIFSIYIDTGKSRSFNRVGSVGRAVSIDKSPIISFGHPGLTYMASTSSAAGVTVISGISARRKNEKATAILAKTGIKDLIKTKIHSNLISVLRTKFTVDDQFVHISKPDFRRVAALKKIYNFPDGDQHSNLAKISHGNNDFNRLPGSGKFLAVDSFATYYYDVKDRRVLELEIQLTYLVGGERQDRYRIEWMDKYICFFVGGQEDILQNNAQLAEEMAEEAIKVVSHWIQEDISGRYPRNSRPAAKVKIPWGKFKGELLSQDQDYVVLRLKNGVIRMIPMIWVKKIK